MPDDSIPVLEIGGTHVTAVLVTANPWDLVPDSLTDRPVGRRRHRGGAAGRLAAAANSLPGGHRSDWVVAVPGPFDYARGIGLFRDVGKFDSLYGVDVRHGLMMRIRPIPAGSGS